MNKLRIAILAPVSWPLPPTGYGPWELVCSNLAAELVELGHEVTVFAAAGSTSPATVVETVPHAFCLWPAGETGRRQVFDPESGLLVGPPDFRALEQQHIAQCMEQACAGAFDVVHSHLHIHALVFSRLIPCPLVSTLHGSAWVRAMHPVFERYKDQPFVSISDAERRFKPDLNYVATVHNGIRLEHFPFSDSKEDFLLFSGRLAPEKGAGEAIEIARRSGLPLKMAAMIEPVYQDYFDNRIKPYLDDRNVIYLGLLEQKDLVPYYQKARALVCPIHWDEPFGLVAVESMACGTPMIGARKGAFEEIVVEGETGFLFDDVDEAVAAVGRLSEIRALDCRRRVEEKFSARVMAEGYEAVFRQLVE